MIYRYAIPEIVQLFHGILQPRYDNCRVFCQFFGCNAEITRKNLQDHLAQCDFGPKRDGEVIAYRIIPWLFPSERALLRIRYDICWQYMDLTWEQGDHFLQQCFGCALCLQDHDLCYCNLPYDPESILEYDPVVLEFLNQSWAGEMAIANAYLNEQWKLSRGRA